MKAGTECLEVLLAFLVRLRPLQQPQADDVRRQLLCRLVVEVPSDAGAYLFRGTHGAGTEVPEPPTHAHICSPSVVQCPSEISTGKTLPSSRRAVSSIPMPMGRCTGSSV